MGKIKYILITGFIILLFSCENVLETIPKSSVTSASMWKTSDDAEGALYGAYSQFRSAFCVNYVIWGDYRLGVYESGVQNGRNSYGNIWDNTLDPNVTGTNWSSLYTLINDCNLIIKYVPTLEITISDNKDFILGNAYFLRAFTYYYIARIWGDAPILLDGFESDNQEKLYPVRESVENVFAQVESDITQAISLIPEGYASDINIATKETAYMLQADYFLWKSKVLGGGTEALNKAKLAVDYIINSNKYLLSSSYSNVFKDENDKELIFSIVLENGESTTSFATEYLYSVTGIPAELQNNPIQIGSGHWLIFNDSFRDFLKENGDDHRTTVNFYEYVQDGYNFNWINKYLGTWQSGTRIFDTDIRVYRYAEVILFKAEIENALGNYSDAVKYLNMIAKRAYSVDNYYAENSSKTDIDNLILNERLKEFPVEGKSWFDLIRFGKAFDRIESLKGRETEQNILLWPVAYTSINSNPNITQTPGYD